LYVIRYVAIRPELTYRQQGLAVIDSAFFGIYGRTMSAFEQDRQNPASLPLVFSSGALAGGVCALLQTPVSGQLYTQLVMQLMSP